MPLYHVKQGLLVQIEGASECVSCDAGYFQSEIGQTECTACPPGKFSAVKGSSECQSCALGTSQSQSGQTFVLFVYLEVIAM